MTDAPPPKAAAPRGEQVIFGAAGLLITLAIFAMLWLADARVLAASVLAFGSTLSIASALSSRFFRHFSVRILRRCLFWAWTLLSIVAVLAWANYIVGARMPGGDYATFTRLRQVVDSHYGGAKWVESHLDTFQNNWAVDWTIFGEVIHDMKSETINIEGGFRRTYAPASLPADAALVLVLGGSTVWGWANRDLHTVPSELARVAEADGFPIKVVNGGMMAWTGWQSMTYLTWLLANGMKPDIVVFYDGWNDIAANFPFWSGGISPTEKFPQRLFESDIRTMFRDPMNVDRFREGYSALARLRQRRNDMFDGDPSATLDRSPVSPELAKTAQAGIDRVVGTLRARIELAERLAAAYGHRSFFFWQPSVFSKKNVEPAERIKLLGREDGKLFAHMYEQVRRALPPPTIDLTGVFDDVKQPVIVDLAHTNELGAELEAKAIYQRLRPALVELKQKRAAE